MLENVIVNRRSSLTRSAAEVRCPLSLRTEHHCLELELFEKDWKTVYDGLDILTDYYNRSKKIFASSNSLHGISGHATAAANSGIVAASTDPEAAVAAPQNRKSDKNRRYSSVY
jgi:predicted ribonuclease toxin of YeeF-YezG toxin-antitoxin module